MSTFKQLPVSELRVKLPKIKRQIHLGLKRLAVSHYGEIVGFLVPIGDLDRAIEDSAIEESRDMALIEFRSRLTECWESLQTKPSCIYVTYHRRRSFAFVSPDLAPYLPIPVSEVSDRLMSV